MKIENPDYLHGSISYKFIPVKRLKELLDLVPEDYLANVQSIAQTGNIGFYPNLECALPTIVIDIGDESIIVAGSEIVDREKGDCPSPGTTGRRG